MDLLGPLEDRMLLGDSRCRRTEWIVDLFVVLVSQVMLVGVNRFLR